MCIFSHCSRDKYFLAFYAEIQDGCQNGREKQVDSPVDSADPMWFKNFVEIALSGTVSEINAFLCFTQKFKMAAKNGGKTIFEKSHQYTLSTLGAKILMKLLYLAVSEINALLRFTQKFKMAAKSGGENNSPVYSADTLWVKNFVEIAPCPR